MKSILTLTTLLSAVLASPTMIKRAACEYSPVELAALKNNFDVNTGKLKLGFFAISTGIIIAGSKCSPAWAVGGSISDDTPTIYKGDAKPISQEELQKKLGGLGLDNKPGSTVNVGSIIAGLGGKLGS